MQELHVRDIIEIYLVLESDDKPLSIEADGQDRGGEGELAYRGMTLHVVYLKAAWGGDEGDKGGRKEHFAERDVSCIGGMAF